MFPVNPGEKFRRITFKISVAFLAVLFIVTIGPQLLELEGSQALAKKKKKGGRYCTATAKAAHTACIREKQDDYNIAVGNCINVSDDEERSDCYQEAKSEYKEAKEECKDQYEARRDVCEDLGEERYDPEIIPSEFVNPADIGSQSVPANLYFPLVSGNKWLYKVTVDGEITETNSVRVLDETVMIEGVECVVVHDIVYEGNIDPDSPGDALMVEDTYDWYAQDKDGNVWYFGERSLAREGCPEEESDCDSYLLSEEGSWKTGVDDAKQGIIMFADPSAEIGTLYRQEFALGDAEDLGQVISTEAQAPADVRPLTFPCTESGAGVCLQTKDFTPIEPDAFAYKYYKADIGVVLEDEINDEGERELVELVDFTPGP